MATTAFELIVQALQSESWWSTLACPSCPEGQAARRQLFEADFAANLVIALLPFLLVGLVCRWAERIGAPRTNEPNGGG